MREWHALTWLGDSGLLLPGATFIGLWLAASRATRRSALLWVLCFGMCGTVVMLSKLAFLGWGMGSRAWDFTGFSGHTALSACFWPVALWLLASRASHRVRVGAALAGAVLAAAIGASRLAIDAHSLSEVAAGYLLGLCASGMFLWVQHPWPHPRLPAWWVAASLALPLVVIRPGWPAPTQDLLEWTAARTAGLERAYTRADLHAGTRPSRRNL